MPSNEANMMKKSRETAAPKRPQITSTNLAKDSTTPSPRSANETRENPLVK